MNWGQFVEQYLIFSRKERLGALALIAVLAVVILHPFLHRDEKTTIVTEDAVLASAIDTLNARQTHQYKNDEKETNTAFELEAPLRHYDAKGSLFEFDPNTLSKDGWKKLGLGDRTIHTIENYRSKGGKFYKPEDLKKIWGLQDAFYERVKDYITIAVTDKEIENKRTVVYEKREAKIWNVKINSADSTAFIELPGIGNKLASRIINFREKLGGFYSVDQIRETYGLADSTFEKIKPYLHVDGEVQKLNINTATKDELKTHPYIKWTLANAIVEFRKQHGPYKSLDDLKNIIVIDDRTFKNIAHYLIL